MYHNNGYLSEEDGGPGGPEEYSVRGLEPGVRGPGGHHSWGAQTSWGARSPVRYYQGPPGYLGGPPYVYPLDYTGGHSGPPSRHQSRERRSKNHSKSDCKRKKPLH